MINLSRLLSKAYNYEKLSETRFSELRKSQMLNLRTLNVRDDFSNIKIQVGYAFAPRHRINRLSTGKMYSSTRSFEEIYKRLVRLNRGISFLDEYFEKIFPRYFREELQLATKILISRLNEQQHYYESLQVLTKKGTYDRRYKVYRTLTDFMVYKDIRLQNHFDEMSLKVKHHLQMSFLTGLLPIYYRINSKTARRKRKLGLSGKTFLATGQLIDNIVVSYTVEV